MHKHELTRRSLITRLGAASFLAVPVFRAVINEAQAAAPLRLVILVVPGGARFVGKGSTHDLGFAATETNFHFGKMLSPLMSLRSDLAVLESIGDLSRPGNAGGHLTQALLAGDTRLTNEDNLAVPPGIDSIDQVIAKSIGQGTRFASLQLGVNTETGENIATHSRLSIANGARLSPVNDPKVVFSRLFTGLAPAPAPGAAPVNIAVDAQAATAMDRLRARKKSVLDLRKSEIDEIRALVSRAEHGKLDEHLTGLREIEKGLSSPTPGGGAPSIPGTTLPPAPGLSCAPPPIGVGSDLRSTLSSMNELTYQAINCDRTRVITLQWLNSGSDVATYYDFLGVKRAHHAMQHEPADDFDVVQTWFMSQAAALIQRFKSTSEGGGSMLDNMAILVISEQSDGRNHTAIPTLGFLAGKAGGGIKTGGAIVGRRSSLNDFYMGLAGVFGQKLSTFGEAKLCKAPLALA